MAQTRSDLEGAASVAVGVSSTLIVTGSVRLLGWSVSNGTSAGTLLLYDALDDSGSQQVSVRSAANKSAELAAMEPGIRFRTGLFAIATGTASVIYRAE